MFKKPFHSFKLELHINILYWNSKPQFNAWPLIFHVQSMYLWTKVFRRCHKRACTETFPRGSMDTGRRLCLPWGCRSCMCEITARRNQHWSCESTRFGNSVLSSQWGETVDLTFFPSFVLFCFLDYVFLCTPTKQTCLGASTSLQTFAACLGL